MAYIKNTWVDQEGQVRYTETIDDGYKVFTPNYEEVTEMGTPVNALNMNHIEDGIEQCYTDLVKRKSTTVATGDTETPVYIKADGTVEECELPIENERFDGQWNTGHWRLSTATGIGVYTINTSWFLPSDNYKYAVNVAFLGFRESGTTNSFVSISKYNTPIDTIGKLFTEEGYCCCSFDGQHAESGNMETTVIVGTDRTFYFGIQKNNINEGILVATAYRRIGENE